MPKKFEKEFISYCEIQNLEVNPNQIKVIKKLEDYQNSNYKSFFSKLFSKQKTKIHGITRDVRQLVVFTNT